MSEEQLIMEAWVYGGFSLALIIGMLWMIFDEKRKHDKTYGKRKK